MVVPQMVSLSQFYLLQASNGWLPNSDVTSPSASTVRSPTSPQSALNTNPFASPIVPSSFSFPQGPIVPSQPLGTNGSATLNSLNVGNTNSLPGLNGLDSSFTNGFDSHSISSADAMDLSGSGPTSFMNLLNDGSFDMNALFNPGDLTFSASSGSGQGPGMISAPSPIERVSSGAEVDRSVNGGAISVSP